MDDLYAIIGCSPTATTEEIKALVKQARLRYHPDRSEGNASREQFLAVEKAWHVLRSPTLRQKYDSLCAHYSLMEGSAGFPVQAELTLDQFVFEPDTDESQSFNGVYWSTCRCGGSFLLDSVAAYCKAPFVPCTDCSLVVRVLYPANN